MITFFSYTNNKQTITNNNYKGCWNKTDNISAISTDGVLEIRCPKDLEEIKTNKKQIEIK
jgi:hypothetical protein